MKLCYDCIGVVLSFCSDNQILFNFLRTSKGINAYLNGDNFRNNRKMKFEIFQPKKLKLPKYSFSNIFNSENRKLSLLPLQKKFVRFISIDNRPKLVTKRKTIVEYKVITLEDGKQKKEKQERVEYQRVYEKNNKKMKNKLFQLFPNLSTLILYKSNDLTEELLNYTPKIRSLKLYDCFHFFVRRKSIGTILEEKEIQKAPQWTKSLEKLTIDFSHSMSTISNPVKSFIDERILLVLENLRTLELVSCNTFKTSKMFQNLKGLEKLEIVHNSFYDASLFQYTPSLQELRIEETLIPITSRDFDRTTNSLFGLKTLKRVYSKFNKYVENDIGQLLNYSNTDLFITIQPWTPKRRCGGCLVL